MERVTLIDVFKQIEAQSEFVFIYKNETINLDKKVDVKIEGATVDKILENVLQNSGVKFEINNKQIIITPDRLIPSNKNEKIIKEEIQQPQKKEISGTVKDSKGLTLPGVSVIVKGTTTGIVTDANGKFALSVPMDAKTLVFSFVGMKAQEIAITAKTSVNLVMEEESVGLEEVVAVGYGTVKRKDLTGSVGFVSAKELKELSVARVDQALIGKVAGVQVKPSSGEPGSAAKIVIRGVGSISAGSNPLYVVDGFPTSNIDMLNTNDIASIDILKDASATAIYGSRGANGVIIINTTRGKEGKCKITFDSYMGWQKIAHRPDMMNAMESAQYIIDGIRNHNMDAGNDVTGLPGTWKIAVPKRPLDVLAGTLTYDKDALDEVLQTAPQQNYYLSFSGGNENVRYDISGNYLSQDGIIINSNFKRYSIHSNIDIKASEKLSIKFSLNPSYTFTNNVIAAGGDGGTNSEGIIGSALYIQNFRPLYVDAQGNATKENGDYMVFSGGSDDQGTIVNPLALANEMKETRRKAGFIGNVNLEYKILPDLRFNVLLGGSIMSNNANRFKPSLPAFFNNPASGRSESNMNINWLTEYTLTYNKTIGKHNIVALGGFTAQKDLNEYSYLFSDKYPNNLVPTLNAVSGVIANGTSDVSEWSMLSYLSRINYSYNDKYYVTVTVRTDGSSRFGADKKWGFFPSVAMVWRVSNENFMKNISFINNLKLRASYGETGNNNIGNYEHQSTIRYLLYPLNGVLSSAYAPQRIENPLLTWETQKQTNFALELSVLKSRLNFSLEHFISRNEDLLLNVTIPAITGYNSTLKNIGAVKNTGWEFTLNTININKKLVWTTDFNISKFENEVVALGAKGDPIYAGASVTMIGKPIGSYYGWLTDGIFLNQSEVDKGPKYNPTGTDRSRPGDVRFVDVSGPGGVPDGIINGLDKTIMGNPYPDFYFGMTNRFSYKSFTLDISLQGVYGNDVFAATRSTIANSRGRYRQQAYLFNYWKSEAEPGDGKTARPNNSPTGNFRGGYSQLFLDDGSYLRINNISLGYSFSKAISESLKMNSFKVYVTATNPFLFTNYHQFNPDVSNNGSSLEPNVDVNDYPLQKSLIIGINVTF